MPEMTNHYESLLAPIYSWMAGGVENAISRGHQELEILGLTSETRHVIDLGAGFGMHSIPLARSGCPVTAVDTSKILLAELMEHAHGLPVRVIEDDLLHFEKHINETPSVILCMGDTITHLPNTDAVELLISKISGVLRSGGVVVLTFRDYTNVVEGHNRFINVKSDDTRILTCFLEYAEDTVRTHDLLHERHGEEWELNVSSYLKLRISPKWLVRLFEGQGFDVDVEPGLSGMARIVATRT
jgi:SAM-dependent methyltransferase